MILREQIKMIAELLEGNVMFFDWDSYDTEEEIPHLIIDGNREDIETVFITKNGLEMVVETREEELGFGFYEDENTTFESLDKELEEMGMDKFLRDIYYSHPRSCEIGDYEMDFLNWKNK